jgi:ZIP family zinc transporter
MNNLIWFTLLATLFTWGVTALGASSVFLIKKINQKFLDFVLGFASGVMIAASFWSLLNPAIELSENLGYTKWLFPAFGFLCGGIFVVFSDLFLDKIMQNKNKSRKRSVLLVGAITLHNIPEGLAIGVAFASTALGIEGATLVSAVLLSIGIGLQNFPEGMGVSLPLRREGLSRSKSFFYGQASGFVEPIAGLIGVLLARFTRLLLPFLLSFAAGCMVSVVSRELIPESCEKHKNYSSIGLIIGFIIMMILDVALG